MTLRLILHGLIVPLEDVPLDENEREQQKQDDPDQQQVNRVLECPEQAVRRQKGVAAAHVRRRVTFGS